MKTHPALAALEFRDIADGVWVTDAVLKRSPIAMLKCGTLSHGRYLTLLGGTTAAVEESLKEGVERAGASLLDHVLIPDIHPVLRDAIFGCRRSSGHGSLAIVETDTVSWTIRAAESAMKGTPIDLIEVRLADSGLAGKGVSVYHGALSDLEAAVDMMARVARGPGDMRTRIISAPHDAIVRALDEPTRFSAAVLIEMDGENV